MAGENMNLGFGLMSVATKRETAAVTKTSIGYLCIGGQPRHDKDTDKTTRTAAHEASPRRQPPYVCEVCGPITDDAVLVRGVKAGKTYTLVDATKLAEAKDEFGNYPDLNVVPHPASDFLLQTGEGKALHYLTPADAGAADRFALIARLIESHPELAFVGLYTPRSATALFHLTVRNGVIIMAERTRTDAMKPLPSVGGEVNEKLLGALEGMLEDFTEPYAPEAYEDRYAATVADLVDHGEVLAVDTTTKAVVPAMTDDELMAKLTLLKGDSKPAKKKAKAKASA